MGAGNNSTVDLSFLENDDDQQSIKQKVSELFESRGELDPLVKLGIESTDILLSKGRLQSALRHISKALGIANPSEDDWAGYSTGEDYVAAYHAGKPTFDRRGNLVDYDTSVTPRINFPNEELQEKFADEMPMVEVLRHELMHAGLQALSNAQNLAPSFMDGIPTRADISQIAGMLPGFDPNPHWDTFLSDYKRDIREDFYPVYLGMDDAPPLDGNFNWEWLASEDDWSKTNPYTFLDPNEVVDFDHDLLYSVFPRENFSPPDELQNRFSEDYANILGLIGKLGL